MLLGIIRRWARSERNVSDDWIAWLPPEKARVFDAVVRRWDSGYAMMSVALDESFSRRARGSLVCARQQVAVASDLMGRLADTLIAACQALSSRGRHLNNLPAVEPLQSKFYRGETARSAASWSGLLHRVLPGARSRFFHKLRALSETIEHIDREFQRLAGELADGTSVEPDRAWSLLDSLHYDLNTCLREANVILKSFLRVLPLEQLPAFAAELERVPGRREQVPARLWRASA